MGSLNKVTLIGNLGKDPESKYTANSLHVCTFSIATTEKLKNANNEVKEKTEWHKIVVWRNLADIVEKYLRKGSQVYIEGKLQTRSWDDNTGQKRYTTEIVADNLVMLGGKRDESVPSSSYGGNNQQSSYTQPSNSTPPPPPEDDLPF